MASITACGPDCKALAQDYAKAEFTWAGVVESDRDSANRQTLINFEIARNGTDPLVAARDYDASTAAKHQSLRRDAEAVRDRYLEACG